MYLYFIRLWARLNRYQLLTSVNKCQSSVDFYLYRSWKFQDMIQNNYSNILTITLVLTSTNDQLYMLSYLYYYDFVYKIKINTVKKIINKLS